MEGHVRKENTKEITEFDREVCIKISLCVNTYTKIIAQIYDVRVIIIYLSNRMLFRFDRLMFTFYTATSAAKIAKNDNSA